MAASTHGAGPLGVLMLLWSYLPLPVAHAIGALLGLAGSLVPNFNRAVARRNLELCFPASSEKERRRLERRSLIETGKTAAETPLLWCGDPGRVLGLVREVVGGEAVDRALAEGRGVIVAGPHLGAWEMLGLYLGSRYPLTALFRPPRYASMARLMSAGRERTGGRLVPTDAQGVRAVFKAAAKGEVVGILPDQDPRQSGGAFADFFGIPAYTMTLLSKLAAKSGVLVVIGYAERLPAGRGYRIHFDPVDDAVQDRDPAVSTAVLNAAVEQAVRGIPAQYQWSYKRFRTRPEGEPDLYRGI